MRKVLIGLTFAALALTALPAMAKSKAAAAEPATNGPIPYSELAAADAKLNGPAPKAKHHMAKKKAAAPADAAKADPKPAN
jgi:hypothetical protein